MERERRSQNVVPYTGSEGMIRGFEMEQKVAGLLQELPFVERIERVTHERSMDGCKSDLDIFFTGKGYLDTVRNAQVQVKSSKKGIRDFKRQLRKEGIPLAEQPAWLLAQRLIILNAGEIKTKSGYIQHITNEAIVGDFLAQLHVLSEFERNGLRGLPTYQVIFPDNINDL